MESLEPDEDSAKGVPEVGPDQDGSNRALLIRTIFVALVIGALLEAVFSAIVWHLGAGAFLSNEALSVNSPGLIAGAICLSLGVFLILRARNSSLGPF